GHYHSGFKHVKIEGKHFINPGSMVRISNSIQELERRPKVVIIDLVDGIDISYKYLQSAEAGERVLDRKEIEASMYKQERIYEFKQNIDAAMDFDKIDINDLLIEVSNAEDLEEDVKEEALRRIAEVQMNKAHGDI
ncbi:MAG TPA: metallophosphoesterase, partial [Tissierellaceae bacterium]|nr:metallophosphoesterase [Tissierellaceae bacterium]